MRGTIISIFKKRFSCFRTERQITTKDQQRKKQEESKNKQKQAKPKQKLHTHGNTKRGYTRGNEEMFGSDGDFVVF